jgi:hypothetical protein
MELDFDRIDINQCPLGEGNPAPNIFAGTDYCKKDTTEVQYEAQLRFATRGTPSEFNLFYFCDVT